MYNETLRNLCEHPDHYDRMIGLIINHNSYCDGSDWAADAINQCILTALKDGDASTGMCTAVLIKDSGKVLLALDPIGKRCIIMGDLIRQNYLNSQNNND